MSRYQFELAGPADDDAIRELMAGTPMPGNVELSFHHEPSYFASSQVLGQRQETIIGRDTADNSIVLVANRSVREMHVGNRIRQVGYLGGLRIPERARNIGLLARGYQFLRELHQSDDHAPDYYLTTIADDNDTAVKVLTSGRAGLPNYHPVCRLHTFALPTRSSGQTNGAELEPLADRDLLLGFLSMHATRRAHFPVYQKHDFQNDSATFRDLNDSVFAVRDQGNIVGVAGLWDQRKFRQTIVSAYSKLTGLLRPAINQWAKITNGIKLPSIGTMLNSVFACFPVVAQDNPNVFTKLLNGLMQAAPADCDCLLVGHCDGDPLLPITRELSRFSYVTKLFAVSWDDKNKTAIQDDRPHYLELGCL